MAEKGTDTVGDLVAEDVLKRARVLLDRSLVADSQHVHEQPFREAVTADDAAGALLAARGEGHLAVAGRRGHAAGARGGGGGGGGRGGGPPPPGGGGAPPRRRATRPGRCATS